jgi:deoxycytidine triphosphate deaminase
MLLDVGSEVATAKGRCDFDIKLGKEMILICEIKIEKLARNKGESDEEAFERLKAAGLGKAKAQIESRGYDTRAKGERKVVKRMAVAIVDGTDAAVEIY